MIASGDVIAFGLASIRKTTGADFTSAWCTVESEMSGFSASAVRIADQRNRHAGDDGDEVGPVEVSGRGRGPARRPALRAR